MTSEELVALDACMALRRAWMKNREPDEAAYGVVNDSLLDCGQSGLADALRDGRFCPQCFVPLRYHREPLAVTPLTVTSENKLTFWGFNLSRVLPGCYQCGRDGRPVDGGRCSTCQNRGYTFLWLATAWACRVCYGNRRYGFDGKPCRRCGEWNGRDGVRSARFVGTLTWELEAFGCQPCEDRLYHYEGVTTDE